MFQVLESALVENPFKKLVSETTFEEITYGRNVATLVEPIEGKIPIVRTTSIYKNPPQTFNELHRKIVKGLDQKFNNAMLELYDTTYKTMKFHTDQSLDLEDKSYIAIYSCYSDPLQPNRLLTICDKKTKETHEIILKHNSIVLFSKAANAECKHKITLMPGRHIQPWIGITYRTSKTYIDPKNPHQSFCSRSS
jgi:hypothetical protein